MARISTTGVLVPAFVDAAIYNALFKLVSSYSLKVVLSTFIPTRPFRIATGTPAVRIK